VNGPTFDAVVPAPETCNATSGERVISAGGAVMRRGGRSWFWVPALAGTLAAGCTSSAAPSVGPHASPSPRRVTAERAPIGTASGPPAHPARPGSVVYDSLVTGGVALVLVGPADGGTGRARLLRIGSGGRRVTDIGPRLPRGSYPDSAFFLDPRHGWLTAFTGTGLERLYRTRDGGRRWRSAPAPSHALAAGSADVIDFADPRHGWLSDVQPTAPEVSVYRTSDAGRTWHRFANTFRSWRGARLPTVGPVRFEPGASVGWLASVREYGTGLYVTRDGGRTWQSAGIARRHRALPLPSVFGRTVVEPVTRCTPGSLAAQMYSSTDAGLRWRRQPAVSLLSGRQVGGPAGQCPLVSSAVASAGVAWVAVTIDAQVVVKKTADAGRIWRTVAAPRIAAARPPTISAIDGRRALIQVPTRPLGAARLYFTSNGGARWRRVDRLATR
jgi:photosystem II stability/assembly factor-like uncharacterized protein